MRDRDAMVYGLAKLGVPFGLVDSILRPLATIQRAHEADCMAWPDDMREAFVARGDKAFGRLVRALRNATADGENGARQKFLAIPQTDPRGACVQIWAFGVTREERDSREPLMRLGAPGFTSREVERLDRLARARETSTK